jgi:glycerol-3-phosphate acyltransferase PlsX
MVEFAMMGRAYAQTVWGRPEPSVRLLNIGEEPGKGNQFSKAAYDLLAPFPWFAGNIEGKQMFEGGCDVVVCEAFAGNVVLKTAQGVGELVFGELRANLSKGVVRWLALPVRGALRAVRRKVDYAEYGGSPLLGLNGLCVICHGRSNARAIENALLVAFRALEGGLVGKIEAATSAPAEAQA